MKKPRRGRLAFGLAWALMLALAWPGAAPAQEPGWCVQCHRLNEPQGQGLGLGQISWREPLEQQEALQSCPGLRRASWELLAVESRLAALSALLPGLEADRQPAAELERGLARAVEIKRGALAAPVGSLEEIGARLARAQAVLMEQVEQPLREQQERRAAGVAWGLALMAGLALALAGLRGLGRLCRRPPGDRTPLELVKRGRLP